MKRCSTLMRATLAAVSMGLASCAPSAPPPAHAGSQLPAAPRPNEPGAPPQAQSQPVRPETPDAPFRASAPPLADVPSATSPPIRAFRLANGIPVLFMEQHALGFVRVAVLLRTQPAPPAANLMAARGVWLGGKAMSQAQLQAGNDADGALMTLWWDWGWIRASTTATADRAAPAIGRLADALLGASFQVANVIRTTRDAAHEVEGNDDTPKAIVARLLPMVLYGAPAIEDEAAGVRSTDIGALRRSDIADAYQAALEPSSAALTVLGDITEEALKPVLEKRFGAWRSAHGAGKPRKTNRTRPTLVTSSPRIVVVDHPGSQSLVAFGGEGPMFSSPDWAPSTTLRAIVGGSKGRAMSALRDAGVSASNPALYFIAKPGGPRAVFSVEVATPRTGDALTRIDRVLREMKSAEVAAKELDDARAPLVADDPAWFSTLAGEADVLDGLVVQGLPPDDVPKRAERLRAVTADDVRRVSGRYLDPDRMKVVVVGDWSKIRDQLLGLGWGSVELREPSGAVVRVEQAQAH